MPLIELVAIALLMLPFSLLVFYLFYKFSNRNKNWNYLLNFSLIGVKNINTTVAPTSIEPIVPIVVESAVETVGPIRRDKVPNTVIHI